MPCFEQDLNELVLIGAFFALGDNHTGGMLTYGIHAPVDVERLAGEMPLKSVRSRRGAIRYNDPIFVHLASVSMKTSHMNPEIYSNIIKNNNYQQEQKYLFMIYLA